jgi:methylmalonyl-CoA/ethylmalonyl-CoA epimerase
MEVTHLRQVAQHVDDMDRAVAFYRDVVGLDLIARFDPPGLAFFDLGATRLLLERGAPTALLYLGVDDVVAATEVLRDAGVAIESEPHLIHHDEVGQFGPAGEAEEMAFFRDSEGNLVGLAGRRRFGEGDRAPADR